MKFSIVTISFNQAEFLERTILSVIAQTGVDVEYIVVDPGSSDGSRDIIERYRDHIKHVIFERDNGPADGLNKGFSYATGDIYCYLNSDDTLEPNAFAKVAAHLDERPALDVVCGHAWVTDRDDRRLRRVWSEPYRSWLVAYGSAIQVQPSTFIRKDAYLRTNGFNINNRSSWDGELLLDLYLTGAKIKVINEFLSTYRLHSESITNSGRLDEQIRVTRSKVFERLAGRKEVAVDRYISLFFRAFKHASNIPALIERIRFGPVYKRGVD